MIKPAIYHRNNHSVEKQIIQLESNLIKNAIDPRPIPTYVDIGSGNEWNRPALQKLIGHVIDRKINRVYTLEPNRLGRQHSIRHTVMAIFEQFNVELIFTAESFFKVRIS